MRTRNAARPNPAFDALVRTFREALSRGDVNGVESSLTLIAVQDPRQAQILMVEAKVTVQLADDVAAIGDPELDQIVGDGDARFLALVEAHQATRDAAGLEAAITMLASTLRHLSDPDTLVSILTAAIMRYRAFREEV